MYVNCVDSLTLYTLSGRSRAVWQALLEAMAHLWHPGDNKVKKAFFLFLCLSLRPGMSVSESLFCFWAVSVCCPTQWRCWTAEKGQRWGDEPSSCSTTCSAHLSMTDTLSKCLRKACKLVYPINHWMYMYAVLHLCTFPSNIRQNPI